MTSLKYEYINFNKNRLNRFFSFKQFRTYLYHMRQFETVLQNLMQSHFAHYVYQGKKIIINKS